MKDGSYLSGESAVLVSGPASLGESNSAELIPIGLTQQAQLTQNKDLNQIFEIGGRVPFFIPGRTQIRAQLSRVLFHGPSLMFALYRTSNEASKIIVPKAESFSTNSTLAPYSLPTVPYGPGGDDSVMARESVDAKPSHFWINLASSIFNKPLGLGIVLYDMNGQPYGGAYLEECFIQNHNFGISANQTVLSETISITATKLRPLNPTSTPG